MSEIGATFRLTGSEMNSAPGGTITSGMPAKVSGWSLDGSIAGEDVESGCAMWTEVKRRASVPKVFDM
jgi:hypothetical protein